MLVENFFKKYWNMLFVCATYSYTESIISARRACSLWASQSNHQHTEKQISDWDQSSHLTLDNKANKDISWNVELIWDKISFGQV